MLQNLDTMIKFVGFMSTCRTKFVEFRSRHYTDASYRVYSPPHDGKPSTKARHTLHRILEGSQTWSWLTLIKIKILSTSGGMDVCLL